MHFENFLEHLSVVTPKKVAKDPSVPYRSERPYRVEGLTG